MNLIRAARAFGGAFALVLLGVVAHATIPLPSVNGPSLGDASANIYSIVNAITQNSQMGFSSGLSVSQTSGQANCTQLGSNALQEIKTSAAAGYVCLPTAVAGKEVLIANATGQTINVYSSAASFASGTADTINGTAGTTAYTGLTTGKNADCFVPANGAWYCASAN